MRTGPLLLQPEVASQSAATALMRTRITIDSPLQDQKAMSAIHPKRTIQIPLLPGRNGRHDHVPMLLQQGEPASLFRFEGFPIWI